MQIISVLINFKSIINTRRQKFFDIFCKKVHRKFGSSEFCLTFALQLKRWPFRLSVRTQDFHSWKRGSIPLGATPKRTAFERKQSFFFSFSFCSRHHVWGGARRAEKAAVNFPGKSFGGYTGGVPDGRKRWRGIWEMKPRWWRGMGKGMRKGNCENDPWKKMKGAGGEVEKQGRQTMEGGSRSCRRWGGEFQR